MHGYLAHHGYAQHRILIAYFLRAIFNFVVLVIQKAEKQTLVLKEHSVLFIQSHSITYNSRFFKTTGNIFLADSLLQ